MGMAPTNQIPSDRQMGPALAALAEDPEIDEYVDLGPEDEQFPTQELADGSQIVTLPGIDDRAESVPPDEGFYENLAGVLPDSVKNRIVTDLLRRIEEDKEARKKRDEQYEDGIRRTGMGKDAPGGAEFEGASRAVHPMMSEACFDYKARVMKEIWPPSGPVKPKILGIATTEKSEKAERVTEHMNWQITRQIKEARSVMETTLTQTPLGGSQFITIWWDHRLKRPRWEFTPIDDCYLPFNAADWQSATRRTVRKTLSEVDYKLRVAQGMYVEDDLPPPSMPPESSKAAAASRKVEGSDEPMQNLDGDREIFITMTWLEITPEMADHLAETSAGVEEEGELYPYLVTMDGSSKKMLAMYRDWEDGDEGREPIEHTFEFPFLAWRGAFGIGFPQVIGGLSAAATGALRALLDSAHANNAIGGFILKGSGASGQTRHPAIGELTEIDGGLEADDIRKRLMPNSFNQPSAVLFQLLGFVVDAARGVVRTSLDETPTADANSPVPVGTQLSRVEEGLVVYCDVFGRAHAAMDRLLAGQHRLNRLYLPEVLKVDADGKELLVRRKDYDGPCDVAPVSEPTIYSDNQRFAQLGYIQQRATMVPQLYKLREVEKRGLKLMKISDPDSLLADQPQPHELNAVNENLAMALGQPVSVFPDQDHLAHLQVLLEFMRSPVLGSNPLIAPVYLPAALKHAADHISYYYVSTTVHVLKKAAGVADIEELMSKDQQVKAAFDALLAEASLHVLPSIQQQLQGIMPLLQQAQQMAQQFQPKPPVDPAAAAAEAAQAETARKGQADTAGNQLGAAKLQSDVAKNQGDLAVQQQRNAIMADRNRVTSDGQQIAAQTKLSTTETDADTAIQIAEERVESGQGAGYKNGESISDAR